MLKKIINQIKNRSIMAIPVVVFLMVLTSALNIFIVKNDTSQLEDFKTQAVEQSKEEQWQAIKLAIEGTNSTARQNSLFLSSELESDILDIYPNLSVLEEEFDNGSYSKKFYSVLEENLSLQQYQNTIFPEPYRTVVATRDGIIAIFSNEYRTYEKTDSQVMSWDEYYEANPNPDASKSAIRKVMEQSDDLILIQSSSHGVESENITIDTLKDVFMEEGIDGLYNYNLLAPSYIKNDSDIFGTKDVDFMKANNSHKLIIIQSIKIKEIVNKNNETILASEKQEENIDSSITNYISNKFIGAVIWSFLLFAMALILISIYNSDRNRCIKCETKMLGGDSEER